MTSSIAPIIAARSRSPKLRTGRRIDHPRFAELMVAMQPGRAPVVVTDDIQNQVEAAPMSWQELQAWIKEQGWSLDEARAVMKGKYGADYKPELTGQYIAAIRDFYRQTSNNG